MFLLPPTGLLKGHKRYIFFMKDITPYETTEHTIKEYKIRRLPKSFWKVWYHPMQDGKSKLSNVYSLTTHMVTQRFKDAEVSKMLYGWHKLHDFSVQHSEIPQVIAAVKIFTLEQRRRYKRESMKNYRANKKAKAALELEQQGPTSIQKVKR
jgi:DNA/RNA endonuclease G (NUC1)